jgi:sec-independent protein translocase protein TatB
VELSVFDLSIPKLLVLAVIALVIFGPDELPKIASQAGRVLRDLRKIAEGARNDLREGPGPEFAFEIEDLNPGRFVQKHLLGGLGGNPDRIAAAHPPASRQAGANGTLPAPGQRPPCDPDATCTWYSARREAGMTSGPAAPCPGVPVSAAAPSRP